MTKINNIAFSVLMISMINSQVFSKEIIEDEVNVEIRSDRSSSFQSLVEFETGSEPEETRAGQVRSDQIEGGVKQYSKDLRKKERFLKKLGVPSLMRAFLINNVFTSKLIISEEDNNTRSFFNIKIFSKKTNNIEDKKTKKVIKKLFSSALKLKANSLNYKKHEKIHEEAEKLLSNSQLDYIYDKMNELTIL